MDTIRFSNEPEEQSERYNAGDEHDNPWIILIADDEGDVHMITKLVLENFRFDNRPVQILSSYSGKETLQVLEEHPNTAVLLLDVVMESYTAGLDVVSQIRERFHNQEIRILLRSGQAGYANVSRIIQEFDINDFIRKENLRYQDLKDAVTLALRAFRDIQKARTNEAEETRNRDDSQGCGD